MIVCFPYGRRAVMTQCTSGVDTGVIKYSAGKGGASEISSTMTKDAVGDGWNMVWRLT